MHTKGLELGMGSSGKLNQKTVTSRTKPRKFNHFLLFLFCFLESYAWKFSHFHWKL